MAVAAAPWLAFALRDPRFFGPTLIDQAIVYGVISLLVGMAILACSGVGNIISRFFSAADCNHILPPAFTSVSITSMAAFFITRLDIIPRSLPVIHFFVLGSLLIPGRLVHAGLTRQEEIDRQKVRSREDANIIVVGANHLTSTRFHWIVSYDSKIGMIPKAREVHPGLQRGRRTVRMDQNKSPPAAIQKSPYQSTLIPGTSFYIRLIDRCALGHQRVLAVVDPNPRLRNRNLGGHRVIGAPEDLPTILHEYQTHGIEIHKLDASINRLCLSDRVGLIGFHAGFCLTRTPRGTLPGANGGVSGAMPARCGAGRASV